MLSNVSFSRPKHVVPADGNTAAAYVAYGFTETSFGYPITPSTPAYEMIEEWANAKQKKNIFGQVPTVVMMQAEGGVAGAVHGAAEGGALVSTFTSSQGLLLMYPNLFKIRYNKLPVVIHVASRSVINSLGTIECDHSDIMAVRTAGTGILSSASNQDAHDLAAIAHMSAIKSSVPFLHFYDGFRTSHQITNVELLDYPELATLVPKKEIEEFHKRAFNPNHPTLRFLAVDSSFHFQIDVAAAQGHEKVPDIVQASMDQFGKLTGRHLHLFDYHGHPQAESVIVVMGSAAENIREAVDYLNNQGKKYGVITVRLFRPFSVTHLMQVIPKSCKVLTVLDRNREPGANTQALHSDVAAGILPLGYPVKVLGGFFGLGGREITPSQAGAVFENSLKPYPHDHFIVGIEDDLGHTNLPLPKEIDMVPEGTKQCIFWGLGSDGTVGANKEAVHIIGENTKLYSQAFFTYDAKKSGGITRSHLRFGTKPIRANYRIMNADYVAVHAARFPKMYPITNELKEGGTFVLNTPAQDVQDLDNYLPPHIRRQLADRKAQVYIIDATKIAQESGIPGRINLIMQAVFFKLSQVLPVDEAIKYLKDSVNKTYGHQGEKVVKSNIGAIDRALAGVQKVEIPEAWTKPSPVAPSRFSQYRDAPELLKKTIFPIFELKGNDMKPSEFTEIFAQIPTEGLGTSKYEKRGVATNLPVWDKTKCIQCNQCSIRCAHAAIRPYLFKPSDNKELVGGALDAKALPGYKFKISVSPYDCLGCGVCIMNCPPKALSFPVASEDLFVKSEEENLKFKALPTHDQLMEKDPKAAEKLGSKKFTADGSQYFVPLLEYSGACGGCHETLYAKMLSQLFGPRMMVANATGCSIVWSGSFPSVPWTTNVNGQGPTWGNSLFEDNAEYGLGIFTAFAHRREDLRKHVEQLLKDGVQMPADIKTALEEWISVYSDGEKCYPISNKLQKLFKKQNFPEESPLGQIAKDADLFVKPAVWIIGGDGWANDIGYGGLDHVVASGADVNILVYDNESYANTGFQMSKGTPRGAVMKFAATGKDKPKKDLARMMMMYPEAYVAQIAIAADPKQSVKVMKEAEAHNGVSFIVAYCPCIGLGIKPTLGHGHHQARLAVESGYWPLFHRDPKKGLVMDKKTMNIGSLEKMLLNEVRFESLRRINPERLKQLQSLLTSDIEYRWKELQKIAA